MKKILCYIGIIIIMALVLFPKALRIFLPDKVKEEIHIEIERSLLYCSNDEFVAITNYEGDNVKMINLKKMIQDDDYKYVTGKDLLTIFDNSKKTGDTIYNILNDGEVLTIDFSVLSHENMKIGSITRSLNAQKKYYESQNLVCEIRK